MKDVAAASGVSRASVSLVVRDSPQISAQTKARVRAVINELGYVYDRRAAVLRAERTMTMGLVVTDVRNPFFAELTMALEGDLQESGYALLLGYSQDDPAREQRLLEAMVQHQVDGIVLVPCGESSIAGLVPRLAVSGTPHVLVARQVRGGAGDYVGVDNVRAGELLGAHVAGLGCRRVAFAGGPAGSTARIDRERGLAAGLSRGGVDFDPALSVASTATRAGGVRAGEELLARAAAPCAIACYNDSVAFGVLAAVRAAGLRPGADVAIGSFDDIPDAEAQDPPLTSVATYPQRVGLQAARLLRSRVNEPAGPPRRVLLSPRLAVRASTAAWQRRGGASAQETA